LATVKRVATDDPNGVVTLRDDGDVDQALRRAVACIEGLGLEVVAVIDHSGDAAEAGRTMPDTKLVLFENPKDATTLMVAHPLLALDLPLKLLISEGDSGHLLVSYNPPAYLAHRHGLTDDEAEPLTVVETIAEATRSNP
jgi:uncharacterized protein (DUF302 family)